MPDCPCPGVKCRLELDDPRHGTVTGYTSCACRCDECRRASTAARYRWKAANLERHREYQRQWWTPEKKLAYSRRWIAANPERNRAKSRRWRLANPEKVREWFAAHPDYEREWKSANRERTRAKDHRRRARLAQADARTLAPQDYRRLAFGRPCQLAGPLCTGASETVDHVIPIARGGRHAIGNLIPACDWCNKSKGDRLLAEWRFGLLCDARFWATA